MPVNAEKGLGQKYFSQRKTRTFMRNSNLEFRNSLGFYLYRLIKLKIIRL